MLQKPFVSILVLASACAVVGILTAAGFFRSMMGFPFVFALTCLLFGGLSIWRERGRRPVGVPTLVLLVGAGLAVGGGLVQQRAVRELQAKEQRAVSAELVDEPAPRLVGLEPLATDPRDLDRALAFESPATIVTFWATWCSPCWKEMEELQELWERHRAAGLVVLAVTSYDDHSDPAARAEDRSEAEAFMRRRDLGYPAGITDDGADYEAFRVRSIPRTVLIDGSGTVVGYAVGLAETRKLMGKAAAMVQE